MRTGCHYNRLPRQPRDDSNIHRTFLRRVEQGVLEGTCSTLIEWCDEFEGCEYPPLAYELCRTFKFLGPEIVRTRPLASDASHGRKATSAGLSLALRLLNSHVQGDQPAITASSSLISLTTRSSRRSTVYSETLWEVPSPSLWPG